VPPPGLPNEYALQFFHVPAVQSALTLQSGVHCFVLPSVRQMPRLQSFESVHVPPMSTVAVVGDGAHVRSRRPISELPANRQLSLVRQSASC